MRLQGVEILVLGQELLEMLGTREDVEIGEDRIALDLAGIFDADMVGVGVHRHDLLLHLRRRIGDVDAVAKRL